MTGLQNQREELTRLGFDVVEESNREVVATMSRWHPDCFLTKMTYVVFTRRIEELTIERLDADEALLPERGKSLDPSRLPRGFQKGVTVLVLYVADRITPEARERLERKPKMRFAWFFVPAAIDLATRDLLVVRKTPMWGRLYYGKFRWLVDRVLRPERPTSKEPLSALGIGLVAFIVLDFAAIAALMIATST